MFQSEEYQNKTDKGIKIQKQQTSWIVARIFL